jgi:hypothetical protein
MAEQKTKSAPPVPQSAATRSTQPEGTLIDETDGNARDREMGREGPPLGDLGHGKRTWAPPAGEQGISNRPDDAGTSAQRSSAMTQDTKHQDGGQQGGQHSGQREGGQESASQTSGKSGGNKQGGSGGSQNKGGNDNKGGGHSGSKASGDRNA